VASAQSLLVGRADLRPDHFTGHNQLHAAILLPSDDYAARGIVEAMPNPRLCRIDLNGCTLALRLVRLEASSDSA